MSGAFAPRRSGTLRGLCAAASLFGAGLAAQAVVPALPASALDERIDALVREGFERPDAALARLDTMLHEARPTPPELRAVLLGMGSVQAQAGRATEAGALAEQLLTLGRDSREGLAAAADGGFHAVWF